MKEASYLRAMRCARCRANCFPGSFRYPELIPGESFDFHKLTPIVNESDKAKFISFVRRMLAWLPEERPTAAELLGDPWLEEEAGKPIDPVLNL